MARVGLESGADGRTELTETSESNQDSSTRLIIAGVAVAISALLCCSCVALAWFLGDPVLEFLGEFSVVIRSLPL